jgi:hypothetical protein
MLVLQRISNIYRRIFDWFAAKIVTPAKAGFRATSVSLAA